jgi:hypothetical protein
MFFQDIKSGDRTSDIRCTDDRIFQVGDYILLDEFNPVKFTYTGNQLCVKITYIQQNKSNPCAISREALAKNYCVLSIKIVSEEEVSRSVSMEDQIGLSCKNNCVA